MARIVMLLTNPFRPDPRVHKEAVALHGAGHEVTILSWDREGKHPAAERIDGVEIRRFGPRSAFSNLVLFVATLPLFWLRCLRVLLVERWDVVHCNDLDTLPLGIFAAHIRGGYIVYDAHEIYSSMVKADVPGMAVAFVEKAERYFVKKPDKVVCVNDRFASILKGWGAPEPVVVMGCNPLEAAPAGAVAELRSRLGVGARRVVLYIGVLEPTRKLVELEEGFEARGWADAVLVLGGFGSLESEIRRGSKRTSIFVGEVHPSQVPVYTHMADVLVAVYDHRYENNRDSVPNKLFEAMSGGKPIVVAKGTWTGEITERLGCGIAVDYDGDEVFDAVRKLLDNKGLYERLGEAGRRAFESEYNWPAMSERLLAVYNSLLD
jgi:glycosyltransferase involved in cell wall biosynthesis